ncbi:MAG: phosphoglucosamine mutase, partial [Oscillospiraceae bacterium]
HIIFREFATTGDGQLTALQVLSLIKRSGESLSKITSQMKKYPQYMQNITVTKDGKVAFYNNEAVKNAIEKGKEQLKNTGRIVARVSGTEPLIRIMAEGENLDEIIKIVSEISQVVKNELA